MLPGVGSFRVLNKPAFFDKVSGIFYPPVQEVVFDSADTEDDGLLFSSYQRKEGLSYNEALNLLSADLEAVSFSMKAGTPFEIKGVGTIIMKGSLPSFIPENNSLKLEEIGIDAVEVSTGRKRKKSRSKEFNPAYYYIPVHKKFARVAASFLLVAVVGLFTVLPLRNGTNSAGMASIVPVKTEKTVVEKKTAELKPENKEVLPTLEVQDNSEDRFFLIVGSFRTEREAEKFISLHEGKGLNLQMIEGDKYFWVSAMSAPTRKEVMDFKMSEEFKGLELSSWILDREKK